MFLSRWGCVLQKSGSISSISSSGSSSGGGNTSISYYNFSEDFFVRTNSRKNIDSAIDFVYFFSGSYDSIVWQRKQI